MVKENSLDGSPRGITIPRGLSNKSHIGRETGGNEHGNDNDSKNISCPRRT